MPYSTKEKVSHVYRRLGVGSYSDLIGATGDPDEAIARALDLSSPAPTLPEMEPPLDRETAMDIAQLAGPVRWWLESAIASRRLIEERLVWFWHDHFATSVRKVRISYLMWQQHLTIRQHATGSFADLLHAMAVDPAMLFYLDGARSHPGSVNENFAREVMELHTMGTGSYTQTDITEAAMAATGWVVNVPYGREAQRYLSDYEPWSSVFLPIRHVSDSKSILGETGNHDMESFLDVLLDQPETAEFVAGKLWRELVGTEPSSDVVAAIAADFRSEYSIQDLVAAICAHPEFLSDESIRSKVRTPLERMVAVAQGLGGQNLDERAGFILFDMSFLLYSPPSPAGYPKGKILLGPHQLIHAFDLISLVQTDRQYSTADLMASLGVIDISPETRAVLDSAPNGSKTALALNSPEFASI